MKAHRVGKVGLEKVVVPRRQSLHDFGKRLPHPEIEMLCRYCSPEVLGVLLAVE